MKKLFFPISSLLKQIILIISVVLCIGIATKIFPPTPSYASSHTNVIYGTVCYGSSTSAGLAACGSLLFPGSSSGINGATITWSPNSGSTTSGSDGSYYTSSLSDNKTYTVTAKAPDGRTLSQSMKTDFGSGSCSGNTSNSICQSNGAVDFRFTPPATPTPIPTAVPPTPTTIPTQIPTPTPIPTAAPKTYAISGNVYNDGNKNGLKDASESNYSAAPSISITPNMGKIVANSDGSYTITNLPSGTYTVSYNSLPNGYKITDPLNGPPPSFQVTVGPSCNTNGAQGASCV